MQVHDDYKIKTQSGGLISLVSMIIMAGCPVTLLRTHLNSAMLDGEALLFLSELRSYLQAEIIAWLSKCSGRPFQLPVQHGKMRIISLLIQH